MKYEIDELYLKSLLRSKVILDELNKWDLAEYWKIENKAFSEDMSDFDIELDEVLDDFDGSTFDYENAIDERVELELIKYKNR